MLVKSRSTRVLLDAGLMDLHERFAPGQLDAVLLTHYHPDHAQGLFHLRWGMGLLLTVYGPPDSEGCADLFKHPGILSFQEVRKFEPFEVGDLTITPLPLIHSRPTRGYAIEGPGASRFVYLTDTLRLPPKSAEFLQQWGPFDMPINCSYPPREAPRNHNDWTAASDCVKLVQARRAWFTHIGHQLDAWLIDQNPPMTSSIQGATDGLTVQIDQAASG